MNEEFVANEVVTLTDEEGKDHNFRLLDVLEVDGGEYAVLLPLADEDGEMEADEAIILKFARDEEGNEILMEIEDDEEWEKVADAWVAAQEEEMDEEE